MEWIIDILAPQCTKDRDTIHVFLNDPFKLFPIKKPNNLDGQRSCGGAGNPATSFNSIIYIEKTLNERQNTSCSWEVSNY
jgi:hypothetical protein